MTRFVRSGAERGFFLEYLQPMLRRFEEMIEALEIIEAAKRLGI
jgi:hypothetical protein